jgi:hypothetical protein
MSGVDTTGLELGSCKGGCREVSVDDGAPSGGDPLQVKVLENWRYHIALAYMVIIGWIN